MLRIARRALFALTIASALLLTSQAHAGSYLDRAALLLEEGRREGDMLQSRVTDREIVLVVKMLAEARSRAAHKMEVPSSVIKAHPHLLLVLEHYERAADAASEGNFKRFMEHLMSARDEERTFRAIIAELGFGFAGKR